MRGQYQARVANGPVEGLTSLREAVRLDPGFAAAHGALAEGYLLEVQEGRLAPSEGMPKARAAASRALALFDDASPYRVLASVALRCDWD